MAEPMARSRSAAPLALPVGPGVMVPSRRCRDLVRSGKTAIAEVC